MPRLARAALLLLASCSTGDGGEPRVAPAPPPVAPHAPPTPTTASRPAATLPPLPRVLLTTERTLVPARAPARPPGLDPSIAGNMARLLAGGFGDLTEAPGEPLHTRTLDGRAAPARGASPRLVARFVHLTDVQLADDESPARATAFDAPGAVAGAARAHEGYGCRILDATVRTINALHAQAPLDFVLTGGDNIDNAQQNELAWFTGILDGAPRIACDSGAEDDPVPGPANDPKDPFVAEGLRVPWHWVTGNHDLLAQGLFPVGWHADAAVGSDARGGTRSYALPGAPLVRGEVPADPRRAALTRESLLARVAATGGGRAITAEVQQRGKAEYWFDVDRTPLRVIVLDTAAETGGAGGVLRRRDLEAFLRPALDRARTDRRWVILASHHASRLLGFGGGFGGVPQPDAVPAGVLQALLGRYDNVLLHLAGHTHTHRATVIAPPGGHAYWEVETSALADWPHQARVIEVWDEDDGFVSIRAVAMDYAVDGDPVAAEGRRRAVVDYTSGWGKDGAGAAADRNVALWIPRPR